jgi:hypothetical protein
MNKKQAGGVAVSGHRPNPSRPRQLCDFTSNAIRHVSAGCNSRIRTAFIRDALAARFWFSSEAAVNDRSYSF